MALARETIIVDRTRYKSKPLIGDGSGSMLAFLCTIDTYSYGDDEGRIVEVDIHDTGRAQVVYATNVNRVADYVECRQPSGSSVTWVLIQSGV